MNSTLPALCTWNSKAWVTEHPFTAWFAEYVKPTVETCCSEEMMPFKVVLPMENLPGHLRALMVILMCDEISVVSMPADIT